MIALAVALGAAPPTAAPITPAPPVLVTPAAPDPAALAEAEKLMATMKIDESMRAMLAKTIEALRSGAVLSAQFDRNPAIHMRRAQNPQAWDAAIARIGALQAASAKKALGDLPQRFHAQAANSYATIFTAAELRALTDFYRTPLGRKLVESGPAVGAATTGWLQQEIGRRLALAMPAIQPQIQQELAPLLASPTP